MLTRGDELRQKCEMGSPSTPRRGGARLARVRREMSDRQGDMDEANSSRQYFSCTKVWQLASGQK